jgi:hypothetical protein
MDKRKDRFGLPMPPRKPELRKPKFWLGRDGDALFFINNSDEILDFISTSVGGYITCDDDVAPISGDGYSYDNILPLEAVKVEEFDARLDCDFVLQVQIMVISKNEGRIVICPPAGKGGIGETVLLWDTGEVGKDVSVSTD